MEKLNQQKLSQPGLNKFSLHPLKKFVLAGCIATLAACGGGGDGDTPPSNGTTFPLTVNVTGLGDSPLMLQNNDGILGENLSIGSNGEHSFPKEIAYNGKYLVLVKLQPEDRTCRVENGEGTLVQSAIPTVQVNCSSTPPKNTITIGGEVSGLKDGNEIVLQNNDVDNITIRTNGPYSFTARYAPKTGYRVSIARPPVAQHCVVSNAEGEVEKDIDNVNITCANTVEKVSVGGTVNGLAAGKEVILTNTVNNNGVFETLPVSANAGFTFTKKVDLNSTFVVGVATNPEGQICTPQSNSGTATGNITTVLVNCVAIANSFTISGNLEGLEGTVTLQNNGGDDLPLDKNGAFTFKTPVGTGNTYDVTVKAGTFPFLQDCKFVNGSGTVEHANVSGIVVKCETAPVSVIHSFDRGNDGYPVALIQAIDGINFYGATVRGGDGKGGVFNDGRSLDGIKFGYVFQMNANGAVTPFYSFNGSGWVVFPDPVFPTGLMQTSDGSLFASTFLSGTTLYGTPGNKAIFNVGAIYQLDAVNKTGQIVDSFPVDAKQGPVADLIQDADGNFYGMTYGGVISNLARDEKGDPYPQISGSIFKRTPAGKVITLRHFGNLDDKGFNVEGYHPNGRLVLAKDGFLYGTTEMGGQYGKGTIFKLKPTSLQPDLEFKVIHNFEDGDFPAQRPTIDNNSYWNPYAAPYSGLIQADDSNLYGVAKFGGAKNAGKVFKVTADGTYTLVYSFETANGYPTTQLIQLKGNFYGTTQGDGTNGIGTIFKITPEGKLTILHAFKGADGDDGDTPTTRLIAGKDNNLYGATQFGGDYDQGAIFKLGRN